MVMNNFNVAPTDQTQRRGDVAGRRDSGGGKDPDPE